MLHFDKYFKPNPHLSEVSIKIQTSAKSGVHVSNVSMDKLAVTIK